MNEHSPSETHGHPGPRRHRRSGGEAGMSQSPDRAYGKAMDAADKAYKEAMDAADKAWGEAIDAAYKARRAKREEQP